jgi:hypothetical protein
MADAVIDLVASNLFGLNAAFKTSASSTSAATSNVQAMDEKGNVSCQRNVNKMTTFSQSAAYCGTDFIGNLGTFLTQFGNVQNSKIVTDITVNMTAGGYATVDVAGHNHTENAHVAGLSIGYANVAAFLPNAVGESFKNWDGFGVPDFGIALGDNASPSAATVTFKMNHIDTQDENGDHLVGKNVTPSCELKMDFEGIPTSNTDALIQADLRANTGTMFDVIVDVAEASDSNSAFDTFSFSAHANPALATA